MDISLQNLDNMGIQAIELKNSFLLLPRQEQVELMQFFLNVIAESPTAEDIPFELSESLIQELDRRETEVLEGKVRAISLEEALETLK